MGKLTKAKGNMYSWCSHVWNPFKPYKCEYQCDYCYITVMAKRYGLELSDVPELDLPFPNLLKGGEKKIFIGHCSDLFAPQISDEQLKEIFKDL